MNPYRVLIVDDEPLGRLGVEQHLERHPDFRVTQRAADGLQALKLLKENPCHLAIVDIRMPEMSGLEFVGRLPALHPPRVVFVTAYDQHALEAFRLNALDYLLKPIDPAHFDQAMDRARVALSLGRNHARLLKLHDGKQVFRVLPDEIMYAVSEGNYLRVFTLDKAITVRMTQVEFVALLPEEGYLRISRSCTVNKHVVRRIRSLSNQRFLLVLTDGTKLTSSRSSWKALKLWLTEHPHSVHETAGSEGGAAAPEDHLPSD